MNEYYGYKYLSEIAKMYLKEIEKIKNPNLTNNQYHINYKEFYEYMDKFFTPRDPKINIEKFEFFISTTYSIMIQLGLFDEKNNWKNWVPILITCELETINSINSGG